MDLDKREGMDLTMSKAFLNHINKYIWSVFAFILMFTMTSCDTSSNEKTTDVINTVPTNLSSPLPKSLEFSIEKDRIDFVAIVINSNPENGFYGNCAKIYDNEGIKATIQALKNMDVYPKDKSYQYYGGDTPYTMINFFDKQGKVIESVNICLDLKLNELVFRYYENVYQINSFEIDKLYEICELYDNNKMSETN